jgi:hypothetical protein
MKPPDEVKTESAQRWFDRDEANWRLCHDLMTAPD